MTTHALHPNRSNLVVAQPSVRRWRPAGHIGGLGVWAIVAAMAVAAPAVASSDAAWDAFRTDVENQCTAAAQQRFSDIRIRVDPFGSADYGLALIDGVAEQADTRSQLICVYDKQDKRVQLGTPLDPVAPEKSAP